MSDPLASFGGQPAPQELVTDLQAIGVLSDAGRRELWRAVEAILLDPLRADAGHVAARHARAAGCEEALFARAVSATRALYREAARAGVSRDVFEADLAKLTADPVVSTTLMGHFEIARARLQAELATRTLAAHGKVLVDVEWRLVFVHQSNHGRGLKLPVVNLTLHHEEHGQRSTTTYDVLPTMLQRLRDMLSEIVT